MILLKKNSHTFNIIFYIFSFFFDLAHEKAQANEIVMLIQCLAWRKTRFYKQLYNLSGDLTALNYASSIIRIARAQKAMHLRAIEVLFSFFIMGCHKSIPLKFFNRISVIPNKHKNCHTFFLSSSPSLSSPPGFGPLGSLVKVISVNTYHPVM